jgi:cyclase
VEGEDELGSETKVGVTQGEIMMKHPIRSLALFCLVFFSAPALSQQTYTPDEAFKAFGYDVETLEVRVETVAPGLHILFGAGGNILASIGEQGVLIVDDQVPALVPKIRSSITDLGGGEIDFVINTHWHFDHADGNHVLGKEGSWIVSHANSRQMLKSRHLINLVSMKVDQPAYPHESMPIITFEDRMQFHFNGDEIELLHFGPAHTTGDTAVLFRDKNVVHMGDVYNGRYPFVDADNGGDIDGLIAFCEAILAEINPETQVIPGHGVVGTYADLNAYVSMLIIIRERIAALMSEGATLEEIIAAKPTAEWDEVRGNPAMLINRAYTSMSK